MSALPASARLSHLLELADRGPALRTALAEEVADLLTHWPADCPAETRAMFESLLTKCAHDAGPDARARLRVQLCTDPGLAARVLPRRADTRALVQTARDGGDVAPVLATVLGIGADAARALLDDALLDDARGVELATACKHAGLERAAFSALVMTRHGHRDNCQMLLDCFDGAPMREPAVSPPPAPGGVRAS